MLKYTCDRCDKYFNQKYNYERHINRKYLCKQINIKNPNSTQYHTKHTQKPQISTYPIDFTHNIIEKHEIETKIKHMCKYCLKNFSRKDVLNRHITNYCQIKKQQDEQKEDIFRKLLEKENLLKQRDEQIKTLIEQNKIITSEMTLLKNKINKISKTTKYKKNISNTINNNTINTTNTNNGVIFNLVNYGKEDLDKIDIKHFMDKVVKNNRICGVKIPEEILKLIHFNPAYPEHNNIYISDINREKFMIYDDGMWKLTPEDKIPEVIDKVVTFSYEKENELREKYPNNKPLSDRLDTINKYTKLNDNCYLDELKDEYIDEQTNNNDDIKRCEEFQKKTYNCFKTTMYNEGLKLKKNKIK